MAFRQLILIRGLSGFRNVPHNPIFKNNKLLFNRENVDVSFVRNLRTRKLENNSINSIKNRKINTSPNPSPFEGFVEPKHIREGVLVKSFAFTVAFSVGTFFGCTILEYERIRYKAIQALKNSMKYSWFKKNPAYSQESDSVLNNLKKDIKAAWNRLSPAERVFAPILAINVLVFGLWRIPRVQPFMLKWFVSNPAAKIVCWPMLLSSFSHYSLFHLCANMYVLQSFSHGAMGYLGQEQFLALYLSAGVFSSFTSYLHKVVVSQPGFSLGASGAIMAILAFVCTQYPDTRLSILFLPQFTFTAGSAIQVICGMDLAGVLFGWRFFDHAAHLGGAAMGIFWCWFGTSHIWPLRENIVGYWHQLRGKTR